MTLRPEDEGALNDLGRRWSSQVEGNLLIVIIEEFPIPAGLTPDAADLLIRLPAGFPDAAPDMFWVAPAISRSDGTTPPATNHQQSIVGRTWQRWSRHIGTAWRPGQDNLATYLAYIRRSLANEAEKVGAR